MAKTKTTDNDDLLGETKVKKAKPTTKVAPKAKPAAKEVKATAKPAAKPAAKEAKPPRAARTKVDDDAKLKVGKTVPREGSMFSIVAKAFGAGTTVKTAVERLKKTLVQPRGKTSKANPETFVRGYIRGALAAGVITNA